MYKLRFLKGFRSPSVLITIMTRRISISRAISAYKCSIIGSGRCGMCLMCC